MAKDNRSFFERLTGAVRIADDSEEGGSNLAVKSKEMWDRILIEKRGELQDKQIKLGASHPADLITPSDLKRQEQISGEPGREPGET